MGWFNKEKTETNDFQNETTVVSVVSPDTAVTMLQEDSDKKRREEEKTFDRLSEKERLLEEAAPGMAENRELSKKLHEYNDETEKRLRGRVYELHGVNADKLAGMQNTKSAFFKGSAGVVVFVCILLTAFGGIFRGFSSAACLQPAFFTALGAALLCSDERRGMVGRWFFRILFYLCCPAAAVVLALQMMDLAQATTALNWATVVGLLILALSVVDLLIFVPYRAEKKEIKSAEKQLRGLERSAAKNLKAKEKAEKKAARAAEKDKR